MIEEPNEKEGKSIGTGTSKAPECGETLSRAPICFHPSIFQDPALSISFIEAILESPAHHSIVASDEAGTIILWSLGAQLLYGYEPHEAIGRISIDDLHGPGDVEAGKHTSMYGIAAKHGRWRGNMTQIRKDGTEFPAGLVVSATPHTNGTAVGYVMISRDLSSEAGAPSEAQFEHTDSSSTINPNAEMAVMADMTHLVTESNEETNGRSVEMGDRLALSAHGDDAPITASDPVPRDGAFLENRVLRLERSNEDLADFAYVAAHDLVEPLRVVSRYIELLEKRYIKDEEKARVYVQHVLDGVNTMQTLISDLLAYSQVDASEENLEEVDLSKLVGAVVRSISREAKSEGAVFELFDLPIVKAHPPHMRQLFQNLLLNALKFMPPGVSPKVTVRATKVSRFWTISIEDNGIGIGETSRQEIFRPFKRLRSRDDYPGSGLGLAICRRIVERHGGTIWNEGASTGGTIFFFSIPA